MPKKILVVDDELEICAVLRAYFQKQGYEVVTSTDGGSAIALAAQERPQIIILDVKMPGISGVEVLRILREKRHPAKIIMLSAVKDDDVVKEALRLGADGYLAKPFHLDQVAQMLTSVSGHKFAPLQPPRGRGPGP